MSEITVKQLIKILQEFPQDLTVIVPQYSEFRLLEAGDVVVDEQGHPRPDGWVACRRPDKDKRTYLIIGA